MGVSVRNTRMCLNTCSCQGFPKATQFCFLKWGHCKYNNDQVNLWHNSTWLPRASIKLRATFALRAPCVNTMLQPLSSRLPSGRATDDQAEHHHIVQTTKLSSLITLLKRCVSMDQFTRCAVCNWGVNTMLQPLSSRLPSGRARDDQAEDHQAV